MEQNERRFAVLIDADNVSPKYIKYILDEVSDIGIATYKRIYGDWTDNEKRAWKNVLLDWSVNPIQQYSYTTGKNATDSAMIIDAMDILYSGNVDGFCLVSSDSDFTKLAQRLREAGMFVMGIGEQKTPKSPSEPPAIPLSFWKSFLRKMQRRLLRQTKDVQMPLQLPKPRFPPLMRSRKPSPVLMKSKKPLQNF